MSLRFRRTLRLAPGLRLNLAKSGSSLSIGGRGAALNFGRDGARRATVGLPGTGLSYRANLARSRRRRGIVAPLLGLSFFLLVAWMELRTLFAAH